MLDADVLALLAALRREDFVPPAYRSMAFVDTEIPLKTSQGPAQSMLTPKVEARLLQELGVGKHERVLEIGAGSGFMAALLGHQAQQVLSMEIDGRPGGVRHGQPATRRCLERDRAPRGRLGRVAPAKPRST